MELKSVLVALTAEPSAESAIKGAAVVARAHEAHLSGLHVVDIAPFVGYVDGEVSAQIIEIQHEKLLADAVEIKTTFKRVCADSGVDFEWSCVEGSTQRTIDERAHYCDLVCVGAQASAGEGFASLPLSEELIFSTGRPVLVIPQEFDAETIGQHIVIAWNGTREAARACSHAMSMLKRADKVSIVTVVNGDLDDARAAKIATQLSCYLAMHGVDAHAQAVNAGDVPVGEFLHDWALERSADLVVMGAYGHSRVREFILGGVTHWSLRNSSVPILMTL